MSGSELTAACAAACFIVIGFGCSPDHVADLRLDSHCDSSGGVTGVFALHNNGGANWSIDPTSEWQGQLEVFQNGVEVLSNPGAKDVWVVPSTVLIAGGATWTSPNMRIWDGMLSPSPPAAPDKSRPGLEPVPAPSGAYTLSIQLVDSVDASGNVTYLSTQPITVVMPGCAADERP